MTDFEARLMAIVAGPDDEDPALRRVLQDLAVDVQPVFKRLAEAWIPNGTVPPPTNVSAEEAARHGYLRTADVLEQFERATAACFVRIRHGWAEAKRRSFANADERERFLVGVIEEGLARMAALLPGVDSIS